MKRLILLLSAVLIGVFAYAQDATVRVHDAAPGTLIPKEIYGQFSEHLGSCIYGGLWVGKDSPIPNEDGYRLDVLNALKKAGVTLFRTDLQGTVRMASDGERIVFGSEKAAAADAKAIHNSEFIIHN